VAAAGFLAVDYLSLYYSQLILSESLFAFCFMAALALGVAFLLGEKPRMGLAVLFGITLAVAAHVRPIAYYASPALLLGLPFVRRTLRLTWADTTRLALSLFLPWLILVAGWQLRNRLVAGTFEFTGAKSVILCLFHAANTLVVERDISIKEARREILDQVVELGSLSPSQLEELKSSPVEPRVTGVSQADIYALYNTVGARILRVNTRAFLIVMARNTIPLLFGPGEETVLEFTSTPRAAGNPIPDLVESLRRGSLAHFNSVWLERYPWTVALLFVSILQVLLLTVFAAMGIWASGNESGQRLACHLLLVGAVVYMLALALGTGHSRHRAPCIPGIALYAGYGLHCFCSWFGSRGRLAVDSAAS
jgi:hypothetical protein